MFGKRFSRRTYSTLAVILLCAIILLDVGYHFPCWELQVCSLCPKNNRDLLSPWSGGYRPGHSPASPGAGRAVFSLKAAGENPSFLPLVCAGLPCVLWLPAAVLWSLLLIPRGHYPLFV